MYSNVREHGRSTTGTHSDINAWNSEELIDEQAGHRQILRLVFLGVVVKVGGQLKNPEQVLILTLILSWTI